MKAKVLNIAATVLVLALVAAALPLALPKLLGYQIFEILTGSMQPTLPVGSLVYVKPCDAAALQPGDIITYRLSSSTGLVETHRVQQNDTAPKQLVTKGDANTHADVYPVQYARVIGRVEHTAPYLGQVAAALRKPGGIAVCVAVLALALVLWKLADRQTAHDAKKG